MNDEYSALIPSNRVSPQTRAVLQERGREDDPGYEPVVLSAGALRTLRALAGRVVPQRPSAGAAMIDLGARVDQELARGEGDGWRYADLPADAEAYSVGLQAIDELTMQERRVAFHALASGAQDGFLEAIANGAVTSTKIELKRWFEDVRADLTRHYVSHPATLERMNYTGMADDPNGFVQIGKGRLEDWEPRKL